MLIPVLLLSLLVSPAQEVEEKLTTYQLVLLKKGPKAEPGEAAGKNMQDAHLANLATLYRKRVALAYGPLQADDIAGIAILDVPSTEAAKRAFDPDPYIKAGVMTAEVHPIKAARDWFHRAETQQLDHPDRKDVEPLVFGLYEKGPTAADETTTERLHEQYMAGLRGLGKVLAEGPIEGDPTLREYIVIRAADPGEAMTLVASDPAVKSRERTLRTHGWTTFKGIFK
ncbi:MAG: hypothetical protein HOQ29_20515 [Acidobacteria bacterium]|nr:hypothetical protein [Acidobacteriota bacterium]